MCGVWSESFNESSVPVRIASATSNPPYIVPIASPPMTRSVLAVTLDAIRLRHPWLNLQDQVWC